MPNFKMNVFITPAALCTRRDPLATKQQQKKHETVVFFKYIILVQSYRYIHRIINNIYKNITFTIIK